MNRWHPAIAILVAFATVACDERPSGEDGGAPDSAVDASSDDAGEPGDAGPGSFAQVYPILVRRCAGCHTGSGSSGALALGGTAASAHAALVGPNRATTSRCIGPTERVTPFDPDQSFLYLKVTNTHGGGACGFEMPLRSVNGLPAEDATIIRDWILNGAPPP